MTPEEKLNHLRDWMSCWIDCRITTIQAINRTFQVVNETGWLVLTKGSTINVIPFDQYLWMIENKTSYKLVL